MLFFSFSERKTCIPEEQRLRNYWIELEANLSEFVCFKLERVSLAYRNTNRRVINLTSHKAHGYSSETIKTRGKYMTPTKSVGKHVRESHDLLWFYF